MRTFFNLTTWVSLWRADPTFKHEVYATFILLPLAWLWPDLLLGWKLTLTASWVFVMTIACLNRALASLIDTIYIDYHPLLARARQRGTLAVTIALFFNVLVWAIVLFTQNPFK